MEFVYTDHAEGNIKERKINRNQIENIVINPHKLIDISAKRKIAQKIIDGKLLRIVFEKEDNAYIIVTAYYTNPGRYR